jgi:hypothetical protein
MSADGLVIGEPVVTAIRPARRHEAAVQMLRDH